MELAVAIVVRHGRAHACLRATVFVEGRAGGDGDVGKGAVAIVVIQNARSAVAGDENVRPAIVVKIQSSDTESVMPGGLIDVRLGRDVFKRAVPAIVVDNIFRSRQSLRTAHHRHAFPFAVWPLASSRRPPQIKIDLVLYHLFHPPSPTLLD